MTGGPIRVTASFDGQRSYSCVSAAADHHFRSSHKRIFAEARFGCRVRDRKKFGLLGRARHRREKPGIEASRIAIKHASHPDRIIRRNLNEIVALKQRFDVVFSYKVVEHIHPDYVNNLIETLTDTQRSRCAFACPARTRGRGAL